MIKSASEALAARYDKCADQVPPTLQHATQPPYVIEEALPQCTLKKAAHITGMGLKKRERLRITLNPAPPATGIVFRRLDLSPVAKVRATLQTLEATATQMNLKQGEVMVHNLSHLMSAFAGLGIDNVYVDLDSDEIPYMDGSADAFSFLIQAVGLQPQPVALKRFIRIKAPLQIIDGSRWILLEPYDEGCTVAYQATAGSLYRVMLSPRMYMKELSRARHAVLAASNPIQRYPNEAQRHGMLDVVGDLYILGANLIGSIKCYQPNHALTQKLMHTLSAQSDCWEYIEFRDSTKAPQNYQYPHVQPAYSQLKQS